MNNDNYFQPMFFCKSHGNSAESMKEKKIAVRIFDFLKKYIYINW